MSALDEPGTSVCAGCGAVLAAVDEHRAPRRPGASPSCARLFEITLRGLREESGSDVQAAAVVALADAAYAAQHQPDPAGQAAALVRLSALLSGDAEPAGTSDDLPPVTASRPTAWRGTPVDIAADLDVVDLPALVRAWAEGVWADWSAAHQQVRELLAV